MKAKTTATTEQSQPVPLTAEGRAMLGGYQKDAVASAQAAREQLMGVLAELAHVADAAYDAAREDRAVDFDALWRRINQAADFDTQYRSYKHTADSLAAILAREEGK